MRVDKYLWAIRVMKTRSRAATHCKEGKVSIKADKLKSSKILKVGDVVVVRKGAVLLSFRVIAFPKSRVGAGLVSDYVQDITPKEELDKLEMIRLSNRDRPNGVGRPSKRERRSWEKAFED
ncbi:MAG: RNA-binding S4 domain-containing protein [Flavobacteriales bacterium]|jgi:ribosome-associated heat shock protein Hsp15|tara:strand:- start:569 stop:931 length:363 start_codon:yes stop_codon:yes gene_type:complete